jgi:hypothetical protein
VIQALGTAHYTVPATAGFDLFSTGFNAARGDAYDSLLDAFAMGLAASGKSYQELLASVLAGGAGASITLPVAVVTPPAVPPTVAPISASCTGKVAAFFALTKGTFTAKATTFSNGGVPGSSPASVAGFTNGANVSFTVNENCTVTTGSLTMTYKDASYKESSNPAGYDLDLTSTSTSVKDIHMEFYGKRFISLFDPANPANGVSFLE